jgi:acyl dehydratase
MPTKGVVRCVTRVAEIVDKGEGKGALIYLDRAICDAKSGDLLATIKGTVFARADGGFAPSPGSARPVAAIPDRAPDASAEFKTLPQQALIYRLNGDMNPLHSDPEFAEKAKFTRPILHGLCNYGIAARAILGAFGEIGAIKEMDARFSAPSFPGETFIVQMWREGATIAFRMRVKGREVVALDNGRALLASL